MTPSSRDSDVNRLNSSDPFGSTNTAATQSSLKKAKPRIVILSVTQDASTQYVPIMNCIFTAQKNVRVCCASFATYLQPCTLSRRWWQRRRANEEMNARPTRRR